MRYFMLSLAILLGAQCLGANSIFNSDFSESSRNWILINNWYEQPANAGISEITIDEGVGPKGENALRITGKNNRGLAMQILTAYPGKYKLGGWMKCDNLQGASASILAEWMSKENGWLAGSPTQGINGTTDWQYFEAEVTAPEGTRSVHIDLLTSSPNNGSAWFTNIFFERISSGGPAPVTPVLKVEAPDGLEDCLEISWNKQQLTAETLRLFLYCTPEPVTNIDNLVPAAVVVIDDESVLLNGISTGSKRYICAYVTDADGRQSPLSAPVAGVTADKQAPRAGLAQAQMQRSGQVEVSWTPHLLDFDVNKLFIGLRNGEVIKPVAQLQVNALYRQKRPVFCTEPWLKTLVNVPAGTTEIAAWCVDTTGNVGEPTWISILPTPSQADGPFTLWAVPPTDNVPLDAQPPVSIATSFSVTALRNSSKTFQIVALPQKDVIGALVEFQPLLHADGNTKLDTKWLSWQFVNYVELEKNSIATPDDELVWKAPGKYPEELSSDTRRDLPAGQAQPVMIRATVPTGTPAGLYTGEALLVTDQGVRPFGIKVDVSPLTIPARTELQFVYWTSLSDVCKVYGVDPGSADGWRALTRFAQMMMEYRQNVITVPWSIIKVVRNKSGELQYDFTEFDRYVNAYRAEDLDRLFCLQHMGGRTVGEWECPTFSSNTPIITNMQTGEDEYIDVIDILSEIEKHIITKGWLKDFCVHVGDEPIPVNEDSYRELSARVRAAAPKLRRIDAIHVPDLQGSLEIWVPQINYLNQWLPQFRQAQAEGNELWFYNAWVPQGKYPNRMIDSSAIKPRVLHWLNGIYDTTGYLHWALNWWGMKVMDLNSAGDTWITWPSKRWVANSSIRYEAQRESLDDWELMNMLRSGLMQQGMTHEAAQAQMESIARQAVRDFEEYTRSYEELEQVRKQLIEACIAAQ